MRGFSEIRLRKEEKIRLKGEGTAKRKERECEIF